ncbi:uncharacterized protein si:dkey-103k4.2 [Anoplopoma fimbria]|uniref:uncharacterized protein si:dkey-103k4.2 n=1 Tax=Anoplopoma fimbria TaxID=229290 RepID=UPI0023ED2C69|nr:uncharacterized protein si:dkey-103k4.2 [Anoplopoma fimbria]
MRIMDLPWVIVLVVLLCAETKNMDVVVAPGHNATLTCSLDGSNVYWYTGIGSQVKVPLARTFGIKPEDKQYYVITTLKHKHTVFNNTLVIRNITSEDYRLYFCGKRNNSNIVFTDTFRLVRDVPIPSGTNCSEGNQQQNKSSSSISHSEPIVYSSLALNVVFVFVIIGLVLTYLCLKRKNSNHQVNDPSPLTSENPETVEMPQYEEIHLTSLPPAPTYSTECIYHKAQLPGSPLPRHH